MKKQNSLWLSIIMLLVSTISLRAGNIDLTQRLFKSSISIGTQMKVFDNVKTVLPTNIYNKNYTAKVALSYNRNNLSDLGPAAPTNYWCYEVEYSIRFFDDSQKPLGTLVTGNKLTIKSDGDPIYDAFHVYNQSELAYGYAIVTITNIKENNCGLISPATYTGAVPSDIVLELTINENVVYYMPDQNGFVVENTGNFINWSYCHGAESYDIEWVYYDEKSPAVTGAVAFQTKEPVRVNTSNQYYELNLTYPKGKVYYRVRGVSKFKDSPGVLTDKYTAWSTIGEIPVTTAFEGTKNWQYVTNYSEDGKYKKVITYYDGTLRNRQVQTNLSSDSTILIAETKYDYEGRGTVNVLPIAIKTSSLSYQSNLNTFANGKADYDTDYNTTYGALQTAQPGLDNGSKAKDYYSNLNTVETTNRNYLPNANAYPYTLTQYMEDGTGRLWRQSSVGEAFKLKRDDIPNHYTTYIYGTPNSTELHRLFGSNVGVISHYQKNAVIDPNGQVSISYLDQESRVVATALAGKTPDNLLPLASNNIESIVVSLDGTNIVDTNAFRSTSVNKIVNVKVPTSYNLKYSLTGVINQTADFYGLCKTCKYDLKITILDDRGGAFGPPLIRKDIAPASYNCPADLSFTMNNLIDTTLIFTKVGTYTIYKELTLSSGAIDVQLDDLSSLPGFPDSSTFITQGIQAADVLMCGFACVDYPSTTNSECSGPLEYEYTCLSLLNQMKAQLSPGGLYYANTSVMTSARSTSITKGAWAWISPDPVPSPTDLMNETLFRQKNLDLNNAWINSLVTGHPEYCHYEACANQLISDNYDLNMAAVPSWSAAITEGYIDPLNTTVPNRKDPFFNNLTVNSAAVADKATMQNALTGIAVAKGFATTDFPDMPSTSGLTVTTVAGDLWNFVSSYKVYTGNTSYVPNDQERWHLFHALYLGMKQKIVVDRRDNTCPYLDITLNPDAVVENPMNNLIDNVTTLGTLVNQNMSYGCGTPHTQCNNNVIVWMNLLARKCDTHLLTSQQLSDLEDHLLAYCISSCGPSNPFNLLLMEHLTTNPSLIAANAILSGVGCNLSYIAVSNPYIDCSSISPFPPLFPLQGEQQQFMVIPPGGGGQPPVNNNNNNNFPPGSACYVTGINTCPENHVPDANVPSICITPPVIIDINQVKLDCIKRQQAIGRANGLAQWTQAVQNFTAQYLKKYYNNCFKTPFAEHFNYSYEDNEYHYTLYYYDQAGNLVQTVPPAGVNPLKTSTGAFDSNGNYVPGNEPQHHLITKYRYNSLDQLIWQDTPDADSILFFYDSKGQLRLSQNAKQKVNSASSVANVYSYTKYDEQGRITEVGEVRAHDKTSLYMADRNRFKPVLQILDNTAFPEAAKGLSQKTISIYDKNLAPGYENLRGREALTKTIYVESGVVPDVTTWYSYDVHGNVKKVVQDITNFNSKTTEYEYDLLTGKVNKVHYQKGQADYFAHAYRYDADNRITSVLTSSDNAFWVEEARYFYYKHGPLARVELGKDKVQGLDYYYTLQGWLKGVNTPNPRRTDAGSRQRVTIDPGHDGISLNGVPPYQSSTNVASARHLNRYVAQDEFAYTLGYYEGDHTSIHADGKKGLGENSIFAVTPINDGILADISGTNGLFNGNISMMMTQVHSLGDLKTQGQNFGIRANAYRYDQLNRLLEARSIAHNAGTTGWMSHANAVNTAAFDCRYTYDANGNIDTAQVNGTSGALIDNLKYQYDEFVDTDNKKWYRSNRLYHVNDPQGIADISDLGDQGTYTPSAASPYELTPSPGIINTSNNYRYDQIGNLVHDEKEEIETIEWTVYGKIKAVIRKVASAKSRLDFTYDGSGNRIMKKETPTGGGAIVYTYYLRDAGGNVMATYRTSTSAYKLEYSVYGSSRLGIYTCTSAPVSPATTGPYTTNSYVYQPKSRLYELSNHLGNVYLVVSGLKSGKDTTSDGRADYYIADVKSAMDYYPFGAGIASRSASVASYRYGFNGKENDGETGWQDYGMRMYNPMIARFFKVDPITDKYPELTPYQFASNSPMMYIDLDGLEGTKKPDNTGQSLLKRAAYNDDFWEQTVPDELGKLVSNTTNSVKNWLGTINWQGSSNIDDSKLQGNAKPKFGIQYYSNEGPTIENKKDVPETGAKIKTADKALLDGLAGRNSAATTATKNEKVLSSDGKGSNSTRTGGTDWKEKPQAWETGKGAAEKITGGKDAYSTAAEQNTATGKYIIPIKNTRTNEITYQSGAPGSGDGNANIVADTVYTTQ